MALLVTLVLVAGVILVLASLTLLVNNGNYLSARTQAWNQCVPVAEAGVEEALTLLKNDGTTWGWTNSLATNGWSSLVSGVTTQTRSLDATNRYVVSINISSGTPQIKSTGYVWFTTAQGQATNLSRTVQIATTGSSTRMVMGLITSNAIAFSGNTLVDSFDSSTNTGSTGGVYDPAKASDQVTVATASTNANAISMDGSCRIWGYVDVGPGGGASTSGTARAGSSNYVGPSGAWPSGIESSRFSQNFVFNYPAVTNVATPSGGYSATFASLPTTSLGGTTYTVSDGATHSLYQFTSLSVIGSGYNPYLVNGTVTNVVAGDFGTTANGYMVINTNSTYALFASSITMNGGPLGYSIQIGPNCKVLMVTSNFTITQGGKLYIDPTSTLTIYASGTVDVDGAGFINAATAKNLTLYGLPTCTNIIITASGNFIGSVYAPSAAVTISGNSPYFGSCICNSAVFQGSGKFHFDQALYGAAPASTSTYTFSRWQEVAGP